MRRTPDAIRDSETAEFVEPSAVSYASLHRVLFLALGDGGLPGTRNREPPPDLIGEVHRQWYRRHALASGEDEHVPLHLALSETHSGDEAVAYQRQVERHPRCVASFGTLAETAVERDRAWLAIGQRGVARKGSFTFRAAARLSLPGEDLTELLEQWAREGRVERNALAAWTRAARVPKVDAHEQALKNGPECRVTTSGDDHHVVRKQLRGLYPMYTDTYGWPAGVKESKPKTTVVQRRIEMGLAHELTDADREMVVREWCEKNLRGRRGTSASLRPRPGNIRGISSRASHIRSSSWSACAMGQERQRTGGRSSATGRSRRRRPLSPFCGEIVPTDARDETRCSGIGGTAWRQSRINICARRARDDGTTRGRTETAVGRRDGLRRLRRYPDNMRPRDWRARMLQVGTPSRP